MKWKAIICALWLCSMVTHTKYAVMDGINERDSPTSISDRTHDQSGDLQVEHCAASVLVSANDSCSDPIDNCKDPIKYLGSKDDCACFACEYGKLSQHNICTKNKADKEKLLARVGS